MAASAVNIPGAFFSEVSWARDTITRINEARIYDRPIGIDVDTRQPDDLALAFAGRGLLFYPYAHRDGFTLGTSDAYMINVTTLRAHIERRRHEELRSVQASLQQLAAARAHGHPVSLVSPGGALDEFAGYFALRGLERSTGDDKAHDENIARLQAYLARVHAASAR